jgi:hypothetical protein
MNIEHNEHVSPLLPENCNFLGNDVVIGLGMQQPPKETLIHIEAQGDRA